MLANKTRPAELSSVSMFILDILDCLSDIIVSSGIASVKDEL